MSLDTKCRFFFSVLKTPNECSIIVKYFILKDRKYFNRGKNNNINNHQHELKLKFCDKHFAKRTTQNDRQKTHSQEMIKIVVVLSNLFSIHFCNISTYIYNHAKIKYIVTKGKCHESDRGHNSGHDSRPGSSAQVKKFGQRGIEGIDVNRWISLRI